MTVKFSDLDDTKVMVYVVKFYRWNTDTVIKEQGCKMTERKFHMMMAKIVSELHNSGLDKPGKFEVGYECLGEYIDPKELQRKIAALRK